MTVKVKIQEWLEELKAQKQEIETRIKQTDINVEVTKIKSNIASAAQNKLSHAGDKRTKFAEKYTTPLEAAYDVMLTNYESIKRANLEELHLVNTLIEQVEFTVNSLDD
ncbi:hypothetical protein [Bacillus cereus]|uniref:hypothetical protein n=1 Tax=Bacillus mycoides TaxID=1405 RepID=UPI000BF281C4|nr:hypothetical protein COI95_08660 [Bacillus cereus]